MKKMKKSWLWGVGLAVVAMLFVAIPVSAQVPRRIATVQKFTVSLDLTMGKRTELILTSLGRGGVTGMLGFFSREADKGLWAVSITDIAGTDITGTGCSGCQNYPFALGAGETLTLAITAASQVQTGLMTIGAFGGISVRISFIQEAQMTAPRTSFGVVEEWRPDTVIVFTNPDLLNSAMVAVLLSDPYGVVVASGDIKLAPGEVAKFMLREILTRLPAGGLPDLLLFQSTTPIVVNFF
jgi:hypothetical protein